MFANEPTYAKNVAGGLRRRGIRALRRRLGLTMEALAVMTDVPLRVVYLLDIDGFICSEGTDLPGSL